MLLCCRTGEVPFLPVQGAYLLSPRWTNWTSKVHTSMAEMIIARIQEERPQVRKSEPSPGESECSGWIHMHVGAEEAELVWMSAVLSISTAHDSPHGEFAVRLFSAGDQEPRSILQVMLRLMRNTGSLSPNRRTSSISITHEVSASTCCIRRFGDPMSGPR